MKNHLETDFYFNNHIESLSDLSKFDIGIFELSSNRFLTRNNWLKNTINKINASFHLPLEALDNLSQLPDTNSIFTCKHGLTYCYQKVTDNHNNSYIILIGGIVSKESQKVDFIDNIQTFITDPEHTTIIEHHLQLLEINDFKAKADLLFPIIKQTLFLWKENLILKEKQKEHHLINGHPFPETSENVFEPHLTTIEDLKLQDLISIDTLQEIQDSFAYANNVASLITDLNGKGITQPSNFCKVCEIIRTTEKGAKQCSLSDKFLGEETLKQMKPYYQNCQSCGFIDGAAPIIVDNRPIAFWLIGQSNLGRVDTDRIRDYAIEIGINEDDMIKAYSQMSNMSLEQFEFSMDLLWKLAQELSNKGYQNLRLSRELHLKQLQEIELNDLKTKFQAISDNALDAIFMLNEHNKVIYWNNSAELMFKYSSSEAFMTVTIEKIFTPESTETFLKNLETYKLTGKTDVFNKTIEATCFTKGRESFPAELSISIIQINNQWHSIAIVRDITVRKTLENQLLKEKDNLEDAIKLRTKELHDSLEKLKSAHEHRDRFFSSMSHELRTPLNAILGFADILDKRYFGDLSEKQQEYITLIQYSGDLLLSLINDLLDITKIDAGRMSLDITEFYIEDSINTIIALLDNNLKVKRIHLKKHLSPEMTTIRADERKFKQIIINLLSNAIKYTPEEGEISISIDDDMNNIRITVSDNGLGIDENDINQVFDDFFQSTKTPSIAKGGVGIGLALSKRLVKLHNGTINVSSKLGQGSSFWFTIPKFN